MKRSSLAFTPPVRSAVTCFLWACGLVALGAPASAEVKTRVRPDGTIEIYNVGGSRPQRAAAPVRRTSQSRWDSAIQRNCDLHSLDPELVKAVIQIESGFDPRAVSSKGAQGLMQLMPATATEVRVEDPFDPLQSIRGGTLYLKRMLDQFGRIELALAAYNAGPTAVKRYGGIPPYAETRDYVRKVLTLYRGVAPVLPEAVRSEPPGRKVYLRRGPDNQLIMTTSPSGR